MLSYFQQDKKTASRFENSQLSQDPTDPILASKTIYGAPWCPNNIWTHMVLHLLTSLGQKLKLSMSTLTFL